MAAMTSLERRNLVRGRIIESIREIGTLFVALSPLDWVLSPRGSRTSLLALFVVGILLLSAAVAAERRMYRGE
jgi:hypothetical protein